MSLFPILSMIEFPGISPVVEPNKWKVKFDSTVGHRHHKK